MLANESVCRAFLREALSDLNSARLLRDGGEYARAIAHSQQCVEKVLKAVLAASGMIVTGRHQVSPDFASFCGEVPESEQVTRIAERLESIGTRSEYPIFGDPNRPIWIPAEQWNEQDARVAVVDAEWVWDHLTRWLDQEFGVRLE